MPKTNAEILQEKINEILDHISPEVKQHIRFVESFILDIRQVILTVKNLEEVAAINTLPFTEAKLRSANQMLLAVLKDINRIYYNPSDVKAILRKEVKE